MQPEMLYRFWRNQQEQIVEGGVSETAEAENNSRMAPELDVQQSIPDSVRIKHVIDSVNKVTDSANGLALQYTSVKTDNQQLMKAIIEEKSKQVSLLEQQLQQEKNERQA